MRLALAILLFLTVSAQAAVRTFYVDYATGNDANSGTDKLHPWQRHPYMGKWTGSYSHQAGDRFIFKGGVTWPNASFVMQILAGGSNSGTQDYYGVDQTWFTGGTWTRPIFDAGSIELAGGFDVMLLFSLANGPSFITIDSIDFRNLYWNGPKPFSWVAFINLSVSHDITITNCFFHNWTHGPTQTGTTDSLKLVMGANSSPYNPGCTVTGCLMDGENGPNSTNGQSSGEGTYAYSGDVVNCTFRNMTSGCIVTGDPAASTYQTVTGCNIGPCYVSFDPGNHSDGLFNNGGNHFKWYGNLIHDCRVIGLFTGNGSGAETSYIWNNVLWNNNSAPIQIDGFANGNGHISIWQNTLVGGAFAGVRLINRGVGNLNSLDFRNNLVITDAGQALAFDSGISVNNLTNANNPLITSAAAAAQGFTVAGQYQPASTNAASYNAGGDLSAILAGALTTDFLGVTRPQSGARWDASAYEFVSSPATNAPGVINPQLASYSVSETAGSLTIMVQRLNGSQGAVSVAYATANGTAVAGTDYTAVSGTLNWPNADATNKPVAIPIANTGTISGVPRTFSLILSSPGGGASLGPNASVIVSIQMDATQTVTIQIRGPTFLGGSVKLQ